MQRWIAEDGDREAYLVLRLGILIVCNRGHRVGGKS
jgi:hypothetical protein